MIPMPSEWISIHHHFYPVFKFLVRRSGLWAAPLSGVVLWDAIDKKVVGWRDILQGMIFIFHPYTAKRRDWETLRLKIFPHHGRWPSSWIYVGRNWAASWTDLLIVFCYLLSAFYKSILYLLFNICSWFWPVGVQQAVCKRSPNSSWRADLLGIT